MKFQILNLVLYSNKGDKREIAFNIGKVNIITGASKTGKTAIIDIIDYCLGSDECNIPIGILSDSLSWVGIRLLVKKGQVFIARKIPSKGEKTSSIFYYEANDKVENPIFSKLKENVNFPTIKKILTDILEIKENRNASLFNKYRDPITATFRHSLFFSFQQQSEIISKNNLFHRQNEEYIPQTIREVLPYFLGAVDENYVENMEKLRQLKSELRIKEKRYSEYEAIKGEGFTKAHSLISELRNCGIGNENQLPKSWEDAVLQLRKIQQMKIVPEDELLQEDNEFERLQQERNELIANLQDVKNEISATKNLDIDRDSFSKEANEQLSRLNVINFFSNLEEGQIFCPLCNSKIGDDTLPRIEQLRNAISEVKSNVEVTEESSLSLKKTLRALENRVIEIQKKLLDNREALEEIQKNNFHLEEIHDRMTRRSFILGKVTLYLDSLIPIEDSSKLNEEITILKEKIEQYERITSNDLIREKMESITSIISYDLNSWSKELKLEHSEFPLRIDFNKLTIVADSTNGSIPMNKMGSGENWVGLHIISHLAIHKWFINQNRPTPRFLVIDQPSQIYFPSDIKSGNSTELSVDEDREAVKRIYLLLIKIANELNPNFQIILTDHADIDEKWFQDCVIEKWRGNNKLIPDSWKSEQEK